MDNTIVGAKESIKLVGSHLQMFPRRCPETVREIKVRRNESTAPLQSGKKRCAFLNYGFHNRDFVADKSIITFRLISDESFHHCGSHEVMVLGVSRNLFCRLIRKM